MNYVLSGKQMKRCDSSVINGDIEKSLLFIEHAASACIKHLKKQDFNLEKCLVICGKGNNGADGFLIAKKLYESGCLVTILISDRGDNYSQEAGVLLEQVKNHVVLYEDFIENYSVNEYTTIIDAIFGIGLSRDVSCIYAEIINLVNESNIKTLSVDIPSGISSDNGKVMKAAVNADVTVTFACLKIGQLLYPGRIYCGTLIVEDIGIPIIAEEKNDYLVTDLYTNNNLLPYRKPDGHKGTFGKVLVIAGSEEISGAAYLCAMAAYKAGCGMVHVLTERHNELALKVLLPEALLHFYDNNNASEAIKKTKSLIDICDVICIGPGLSMDDCSKSIVEVTIDSDKPMVIDADALNIISKNNLLNKISGGNCVITPHIMEMNRLSGMQCTDIKENAVSFTKSFACLHNLTLVLKDAVTIVASPNRNSYINRSGNCAMAKAGSGDVLAGIISALIAQKCTLHDAACLGVYIHGLIGDIKVMETGQYGLMARNLIEGIEVLFDD